VANEKLIHSSKKGPDRNSLRLSQLLGMEVVGNNGWLIGKVEDVIFSENSWQIDALDVRLEANIAKEFDMKRRFRKTHVRLNISNVQGIGDHVTLKTSKQDIYRIIVNAHGAATTE
jgi:sporulation protein YlmC with PRC-barrel domain